MGVTNNIRNDELLAIATSSSHVFHVASYAVLNEVTQKISGGKLDYIMLPTELNPFFIKTKVAGDWLSISCETHF